jgi:hypothetical protein
MGFFDGSSLPDYYCAAKLADNVSFVQLVNIGSNVIGFTQIEVDVLLGHASVHF